MGPEQICRQTLLSRAPVVEETPCSESAHSLRAESLFFEKWVKRTRFFEQVQGTWCQACQRDQKRVSSKDLKSRLACV